jgi:hypothetical protein
MDKFLQLQGAIDKAKLSLSSMRLPPGLSRGVEKLDASFTTIAASADSMSAKVTTGFGEIDAAISTTQGKLAALRAEMRNVGNAGSSIGGLGGGGWAGGRRGTGGGRGPHVSSPSLGLPGSMHANMGSAHGAGTLGLGIAGAIGYGIVEEGEIEDIVARMLLTGQVATPNGMTQSNAFKQIRDAIQTTSEATGVGPKKAGEAFLQVERQFGGFDLAKRVELEKQIAPYAASEAKLKETDFGEAFESLVGLTHMTGTYDAAKIPELMRQFQYASLITPASISSFKNALSYSMPMLHAGLDMDPSSIMFLTSMMQTAGVSNSKSGTWLRSFFENAEPRIGDNKSDITHNAALHQMGMLDADNHVTWQVKGADGKTDWDASILKMSQVLNKFTQDNDPATRLGLLRQGFGERGGGFAALMNLPQFIEQFPTLEAKMRAFQGGNDTLDYLNKNSPVQQSNLAWSQMQNVLMDIGKVALPAAVAGLGGVRDILNAFKAAADGKDPFVNFFTKPHLNADGSPEMLDSIGKMGAQAATLPSGAAIHSALTNRPGAMANSGGSGDLFKGAVTLPPPVVNANVSANLNGAATVKVGAVNVTVSGQPIAAAIAGEIKGMIEGMFQGMSAGGTNGDSGHDGREGPAYPDHFHGGGH